MRERAFAHPVTHPIMKNAGKLILGFAVYLDANRNWKKACFSDARIVKKRMNQKREIAIYVVSRS